MAKVPTNNDTGKFLTTSISGISNVFDRVGYVTSINEELLAIKNGKAKEKVIQLRKTGDQNIKKSLRAVTWSGHFKGRSKLIAPSGLMCLDLDKVAEIERSLKNLKKDPYVFAAWISPSGNGIKFLVRIPTVRDTRNYKRYYLAALEHFKDLDPDKSTSDINRLCFTSWDPNLYINMDAEVFIEMIELRPRVSTYAISEKSESELSRIAFYSFQKWEKSIDWANGNRNNALFKLGCKWGALGIPKEMAHKFLLDLEDVDFSASEIISTIASAYRTVNRKMEMV